MHDTPSIRGTDKPPGNYGTCEDEDPTVATIGYLGICNERLLHYIVKNDRFRHGGTDWIALSFFIGVLAQSGEFNCCGRQRLRDGRHMWRQGCYAANPVVKSNEDRV